MKNDKHLQRFYHQIQNIFLNEKEDVDKSKAKKA
jgi:hypothetical protein